MIKDRQTVHTSETGLALKRLLLLGHAWISCILSSLLVIPAAVRCKCELGDGRDTNKSALSQNFGATHFIKP